MDVNLVSVLPVEFEADEFWEISEEDFVDDNLEWTVPTFETDMLTVYDVMAQFDRPTEAMKEHLRPLHIRAIVEGIPTNLYKSMVVVLST